MAVFALYNQVMQRLNEDVYEALFIEHETEGKTFTIVDEWREGFLRGVNLWAAMTPAKADTTGSLL